MRKTIMSLCFLALSSAAMAGSPTSVNNSTGNTTYGTEQALAVQKDTAAGYNRTAVKYSSGYQYVNDDAAWSRYAALKAGLSKPVDAPNSTVGLSYDAAKAIVGCSNGSSYASWPNVGQPDYIADNCAFANAVKAASQ